MPQESYEKYKLARQRRRAYAARYWREEERPNVAFIGPAVTLVTEIIAVLFAALALAVWLFVFIVGKSVQLARRRSTRVAAAFLRDRDETTARAALYGQRSAPLPRQASSQRATPEPRAQILGPGSIWPHRFTEKWFIEKGPYLSPLSALQLGRELHLRGWTDGQIRERAAPHVRWPLI